VERIGFAWERLALAFRVHRVAFVGCALRRVGPDKHKTKERRRMNNTIFEHYIICALWSSVDDDENPMDDNYDIDDIDEKTLIEMREDVADFVQTIEDANIDWSDVLTEEQFGHDFWLTRNGHGAGFWDRGLGDIGDKLTEHCKAFGAVDLYVGDDGKIYSV
jgi:hypothetical protein